MSTVTADQKRRVPLPGAQPGDVFDVQNGPDGNYVLEKLFRQTGPGPLATAEVLAAMAAKPLEPRLSWEEFREQTREP